MYECDDKLVSHPSHYQSETGLEVIEVIKAFTFDLKGIEATDTGNILKYMCRWKHKNGLQDLKKARWYLEHLINHVETLEKEKAETAGLHVYDDITTERPLSPSEVQKAYEELVRRVNTQKGAVINYV